MATLQDVREEASPVVLPQSPAPICGGEPGPDEQRRAPGCSAGQDPGADETEASVRFTIGDLAEELGITTRAIRFYEAKQLIAPERRGTMRAYTRRDRGRLLLILRGKNLGFTLEEIREFLDLYDTDPTLSLQARHLQAKVEAAMSDLQRKRIDLERTLDELGSIREECIAHLHKQKE